MSDTTSAAQSLLPCPFCGHDTPEFERLGTSSQSCIVACGNCGARHESGDEYLASGTSWNCRVPQPAPAAHGDALTYEQSYAIRQGHEIASSDAYFEARPQSDNNDRRGVFRAGFDRGWDAARSQAKKGGA